MNLIVDLDNTLIFKDVMYYEKSSSVYNKVYIDLLEREDGNLGVMCNKTLSFLKNFSETKNKLILFSNRDKECFDNINLSIHGVKSFLNVLSFGYEIYKNDNLDLDWVCRINDFRAKNEKDLNIFHNFISSELPNDLLNDRSYGYLIRKKDLLDDYDFISYDYLKYYLEKYSIVKVYEDELNLYLVMSIFSNEELYNYIENMYKLDNLSCIVCSNESFFIDLMLNFQDTGIINFNTGSDSNFEEYLLINNLDSFLNTLIEKNIYIMNGKEVSSGEEIMYRVYEILIDSL